MTKNTLRTIGEKTIVGQGQKLCGVGEEGRSRDAVRGCGVLGVSVDEEDKMEKTI